MMKKVKFIVFICLFILLPLAYFNGFIRISDLTSEQESIAKKYGGVYVFDEKLEKEIDKREEEIKELRDCYSSKTTNECELVVKKQVTTDGYFLNKVWNNNKEKFRQRYNTESDSEAQDKFIKDTASQQSTPIQTLSNGKRYYLRWVDYENETRKKIKTPQIYKDKIKVIGVFLDTNLTAIDAKAYAQNTHVNFPISIGEDNEYFLKTLGGIEKIPYMIFVDDNGEIKNDYTGLIPQEILINEIERIF